MNPTDDGRWVLGVPGFTLGDTYDPARLADLSLAFWREAEVEAQAATAVFRRWEADESALTRPEQSQVLIDLAPTLTRFLTRLFGIEAEYAAMEARIHGDADVFWFKRDVVTRRVVKNRRDTELGPVDADAWTRKVRAVLRIVLDDRFDAGDLEGSFARACRILDSIHQRRTDADSSPMDRDAAELAWGPIASRLAAWDGEAPGPADPAQLFEVLRTWVRLAVSEPSVQAQVSSWVSFRFPHKVDFTRLVHLERPRADRPEILAGPSDHLTRRDGFHLTDARMGRREILSEIDYCILCHEREKDSCSRGLREKDGNLKKNPLGIPITGCPLDERISEAHALKAEGDPLAALAVIMIDNPMVPGTGHRICNDCMKGCIFQNQDPVDIPQAETGALTDVLNLRWGPEIYLLLTRWNPLDRRRPQTRPYHGHNVLVVGLGPAGYTLAHHLCQEGFGVIGIDGLKIEPFSERLLGAPGLCPPPIERWADLWQDTATRPLAGFGGVSEYGITVRWDKNFLTLLHLSLARRRTFSVIGGVRFGGTITLDDAWQRGFHHVAIAAGAGRPTIIDMENNLAPGIRKASDFLMALQLTGAGKRDTIANLQVRLPALVIGGGLTGIDTATELVAYYPLQVEKVLDRYEGLVADEGPAAVRAGLSGAELEMLDEFLLHGAAVREERRRAEAAGEVPDFLPLVQGWGGVHLAYRRGIDESPAYRLNHEEVQHALGEGIWFAEKLSPKRADLDEHGWVRAVEFEHSDSKERVTLAARTVCVAAGTAPNVIYEKENPGTFVLDERRSFFQMHRVTPDGSLERVERGGCGFFTSYDGGALRRVSFYGDNHPVYAGSVVRAMASAKDGHVAVVETFADRIAAAAPAEQGDRDRGWARFRDSIELDLGATVERVTVLTPTIVEVVVRAPAAARRFEPGQFYRLHDFEADAPVVDGTRLAMEGLALTGAWVDKEQGLLSTIVLEMGGSSRLVRHLRPGQRVVVMGPTGAPTHVAAGETVALVGGGLGNAVLFSIGRAFRAAGSRVVYFAGYRNPEDIYKIDEIEAAADQVIWCCDREPAPAARRPQDRAMVGNIVAAMHAYVTGGLGDPRYPGPTWDRLIAIGSDRMMLAVKNARHGVLAPYLTRCGHAVGSINSPMQCMMKEVCAQCLQKHRDPVTGKHWFVFSCFNQDQDLDAVDFPHLAGRLRQNAVQERITDLWVRARLPSLDGQGGHGATS